jgi:hypothetical protein
MIAPTIAAAMPTAEKTIDKPIRASDIDSVTTIVNLD